MQLLFLLAGCAWISSDDVCAKTGDCGPGTDGTGTVDSGDTDTPGDDTADTDEPGDDTGGGGDDTATGDDTGGCDPVTWYRDSDGDGWGVDTDIRDECEAPSGYVADAGDCDDTDTAFHPTAPDACDDGVDHDCSGGDDTCTFDGEQDVETAAGAILTGAPGDLLGTDVGVAGDLDGDGFEEVVIGSTASNAVWLVSGDLGLSTLGAASPADVGAVRVDGDGSVQVGGGFITQGGSTPGVWLAAQGALDDGGDSAGWLLLDGMPTSASVGTSAAAALVVDTDGATPGAIVGVAGAFDFDAEAELLLGARTTEGGLDRGRAWLWDGAASGTHGLDADAAATFTLNAGNTGREFGASVALCDVDGDGRDDAFVGAPGGSGADNDAGAVFAWEAVNVTGDLAASSADWIIQIPASTVRRRIGDDLACGDLDGDGTPALIVGSTSSGKAQASILEGGGSWFPASGGVVDLRYPAIVSDLGDPDFYLMDLHLAVMPDADADGKDELVMAWPGLEDDPDSNDGAGRVYVVSGPISGNTSVVEDGKAVFRGDVPQRGLGASLAVADDLDGDGYGDLVLGNAGVAGADGSKGSVFLLFGGSR